MARVPGAAASLSGIARNVTQIVVDTTSASGAYVERFDPQTAGADVEVIAATGESVPTVGTRAPYPGSLTEQIIESGEPHVITEAGEIGESVAPYLRELCRGCSALVIPLYSGGQTTGALILLRSRMQEHFRPQDTNLAHALGEMVSEAFRRVSLVDELRQVEERFREFAENVDEVFWTANPDFTEMLYVNPAFENVWGRSRETLYQRPQSWLDAVCPEDRPRVDAGLEHLRRGEHFEGEYRIIRPHGDVRWVRSRGIPLRGASGEVYRIVGITDDVTARKQAETERERLLKAERKSREEVSTILERITDNFFAIDREWRFTYVNREAERVFRRRREDLLGKNLWEEFPEIVGSTFYREYHRAIAEQRTVEFEEKYQGVSRDIWTDVRAYPSEEGLSVFLRDITERKQAQEALRESEERFRALAQNAAAAIFVIDEESTIIFANPAAERIFGYHTDELIGHSLDILMPEDQRSLHRAGMQRYIAKGIRGLRWEGVELPGLTRDGRVIPLEISFGEFARDGRRFFTGIARDISERKRDEEERARLLERERAARGEAEAAEQRSRFLAEASRILGSSLDYEKTLVRVARLAVPAMADYCVIDVLGDDDELHRVGGDHVSSQKAHLVQALRRFAPVREVQNPSFKVLHTGQPELLHDVDDAWMQSVAESPEHLEIIRALGPRSIIVGPLRVRDRTLGVLWLVWSESGRRYAVEDVAFVEELGRRAGIAIENARLHRESEEARAEAERRREELQQVSESRARLLRGFTHDVKNPLGAADGFLSLLEDGLLDGLTARQKQGVGKARRSINTALDLIQDLLELARAEAGEIEIERAPTDLRAVAREVAEEQRGQAEAKGLALTIDTPNELPPIYSDSNRVRQVLGNLLSNAVKYTEEGGIQVRVESRERGIAPRPGRWSAVHISDTGPGIPEEQQRFLFQEFRRLDTAGEEKGAGIGLAISLRIARALGGDITVESKPGSGSTFTLWLPLRVR